ASRPPPADLATGASRSVGARRGPDGGGLAAPDDPAAGLDPDRPDDGPDRGDPGPRDGAHPSSRLPGQPAAVHRRDAALLSPGGVVGVAADPRGAGVVL